MPSLSLNIRNGVIVKLKCWIVLKNGTETYPDSLHKIISWLIQVTIIQMKSQGMTNEINSVIFQAIFSTTKMNS